MGRPSRHKIALRQCAANARVSSVGTSGPKAPFSYDTDRRDGITASLKRSPRCPRPQGVVSPEVTALAPAPTPTPVRVPSRRSLLDVTKGTAANRFADVRAVLHRIGESFDDLRNYFRHEVSKEIASEKTSLLESLQLDLELDLSDSTYEQLHQFDHFLHGHL